MKLPIIIISVIIFLLSYKSLIYEKFMDYTDEKTSNSLYFKILKETFNQLENEYFDLHKDLHQLIHTNPAKKYESSVIIYRLHLRNIYNHKIAFREIQNKIMYQTTEYDYFFISLENRIKMYDMFVYDIYKFILLTNKTKIFTDKNLSYILHEFKKYNIS